MAQVVFTANVQRHLACPSVRVDAGTVADALAIAFAGNPRARGYFLDDQGGLRTHVVVFVDGAPIRDRAGLGDPIQPDSEICVMQALSGG